MIKLTNHASSCVAQSETPNHVYLDSGNSSFKRLVQTDKNAMVRESLYIRSTI